jgi:hypothetical protein
MFYSAGLGVKAYPFPWLSAALYVPFKWNVGRDDQTDRSVDLKGIGDLSASVGFDLLELIMPSMVRTKCPETGGPLLALKDDDELIKSPHLVLVAGIAAPTGDAEKKVKWWSYPPQYQPGTGVWNASVGAFYSQGLGPFVPGAGIVYGYGGGENPVGYRKPDTLTASASLQWSFWPKRLARLLAGINVSMPLDEGSMIDQNGERYDLEGSDMALVTMDIGASLWTFSFWQSSRKVMSGLLLTLPLREGRTATEPRQGTSLSLFTTFGF